MLLVVFMRNRDDLPFFDFLDGMIWENLNKVMEDAREFGFLEFYERFYEKLKE